MTCRHRTASALGSLLCVTLLSAVPTNVDAAGIGAGSYELTLEGGLQRSSIGSGDDDTEQSTAGLETGLAYSLTPTFAVGTTLGLAHQSGEGILDRTALSWTADLVVNLNTSSNFVPFARLSLGVTRWSIEGTDGEKSSAILPMVGGGVRAMVGRHAAVRAFVGYRRVTNAFGLDGLDQDDVFSSFGVSLFPVKR